MKNEADVKKAVKKILTEAGWFLWMPPANAYGRSGIADINAVKDGLLMVVETKFGNNKPTPLQAKFLRDVYTAGGIVAVINEKSVEQFEGNIVGDAARKMTVETTPLEYRVNYLRQDMRLLPETRKVFEVSGTITLFGV